MTELRTKNGRATWHRDYSPEGQAIRDNFADALYRHRVAAKQSQRAVAEAAGMTKQAVWKIEKGKATSLPHAKLMADFLGFDLVAACEGRA